MGAIDGPSLLLVLAGGFCLGLYGLFGIDAAGWMLGEQYKPIANAAVGMSALWQFFRQPWWG